MNIIIETIYKYWLSPALYSVTKLGIVMLLKSGQKSIDELFEILKADYPNLNKDNLYRLMRNLSAVGILKQDAGKSFLLGMYGEELLDSDIRECILQNLGEINWEKISNIGEQGDFDHFESVFMQNFPKISEELSNIIFAYRPSKALYLFVKLGLADVMNSEFTSIGDLAKIVNVKPPILETILVFLTAKEIVIKNKQGDYSLSDVGKYLSTQNSNSLKNVVLHENIPKWQAASHLLMAITEGNVPFKVRHGEELFSYLKKLEVGSTQEFDIFSKAMAEISKIEIESIERNLPLPEDTQTIMDVGGGTGALMSALLKRYSKLQGIIFDLPETVAQTKALDGRCRTVGGSFFEKKAIPKVDLIFLKRTLHDWSDDVAIQILKNCAEKCKEFRVVEWLWKDNAFISSLDFFLMSIGGKIRSEQDFRRLFKSSRINCPSIKELNDGFFAVYGKTIPEDEIPGNTCSL